VVSNKCEVALDLCCISSLRCWPLHTMTKASLENTVSWFPWTLHTQLLPCLHPQHQTLQLWCNPSVHLAELSQLTVLSEAYPSWICNLVLDQFCVLILTLLIPKVVTQDILYSNDSRGSRDGGICQDDSLLPSHLLLELYIKCYKLQRLNK